MFNRLIPCCKVDREYRGNQFSNRIRNSRANGPNKQDQLPCAVYRLDYAVRDGVANQNAKSSVPLLSPNQISPLIVHQSVDHTQEVQMIILIKIIFVFNVDSLRGKMAWPSSKSSTRTILYRKIIIKEELFFFISSLLHTSISIIDMNASVRERKKKGRNEPDTP